MKIVVDKNFGILWGLLAVALYFYVLGWNGLLIVFYQLVLFLNMYCLQQFYRCVVAPLFYRIFVSRLP